MDERTSSRACPLCSQALIRTTCPECGLWWPASDLEDLTDAGTEGHAASSRIELRPKVPIAWPIALLAMMSLGYGAAAAGIGSVVHSPSSLLAWISALGGLVLGGLVQVGAIRTPAEPRVLGQRSPATGPG